jgi:hypothetical protein
MTLDAYTSITLTTLHTLELVLARRYWTPWNFIVFLNICVDVMLALRGHEVKCVDVVPYLSEQEMG